MHSSTVTGTQGRIAVLDSGGAGPALVLVHGNSACKEVFAPQLAAPELAGWRRVAFDLPGHGASDDAADPAAGYTFAGYAQALAEVVGALGLDRPAVFGWSLGGHAALEAVGRGLAVRGLAICGTPPVRPALEDLMAAFNLDPAAQNLTAKRDFTEADALAYALHTGGVDGQVDPHLLAMVRRTDGQAREIMFGSVIAGAPLDERAIVAGLTVPLAILNGAEDPFIRPDFFDSLTAPTLLTGATIRIPGAGHAPFRQTPAVFNARLAAFLDTL